MDSDSLSSAPRSDTNIANIGAGAQLKQFAQGSNITQIEGYTAEQVRVLIADIRASYQPKPFDGKSPYVGLASFQEQDADRFFGREKLTKELVARIETARFLVIAGPSGSGKSSLARAGLLHTLRKGALAGSENWLYEILTPGRNPLAELARVVSSFTKSLETGDEILKRGRADETLLHRWANIALGDQKMRRAILLVDQFEEVFTQGTDESERAAFLNLLVYAATIENGRVTIVCCTRSDFIGNWVKSPNLNDLLRHGLYQIPPMQPDELVSAIARPAIQVGLPIDETLVKEILDDMRASPGALPLMQFALQDLFEYEKNQGGVIALTRDDYKERGGLHQALSRHADAAFAKLNAAEQKIARSIFASLIEPGRGNVDTKRTARLQEIVPADTDAVQVKSVITKLADARLVTTDKKDADETITLAHERLIDAWKWLRDLIDENRAAIALQNQINDDAKEWEQQGHDASYLYTGARLATAQEEVEKKKIELSTLAQEFVRAGKYRSNRIRNTVLFGVIFGTGIVSVLTTLTVLALTGNLNTLFYPPHPMEWKLIPSGEFVMGSTIAEIAIANQMCQECSFSNEVPDHRVYLDSYEINRYEVTNREYQQCTNARICAQKLNVESSLATYADHPVTGIGWTNAQNFCNWVGGRLPTEAEWEKAAKGTPQGSNQNRTFPWGNTWDSKKANAGFGKEGKTMPVGSFSDIGGDSPYGVSDMAGNVWEWVSDWYSPDYYSDSESKNPFGPILDENDPSSTRVIRGGSFTSRPAAVRSTYRSKFAPQNAYFELGFRCVRVAKR